MSNDTISVEAKFLCRDITKGIKSGIYTLEEGSTIADLLTHCEAQNNKKIDERQKDNIIFLVDDSRVSVDYVLKDKQTITAVRLVFGG
jgi:sulfur carrier protein ThiS